jgi:hypothetical protein
MKKIILFFFLLSINLIFFGQGAQRMAILPSALQLGSQLSSVCIDYFRDIPKTTDRFTHVASVDEMDRAGLANFHGARGTGNTTTLSTGGSGGRINNEKPVILSAAADDDHIAANYQEFITTTMDSYKGKAFTDLDHAEMQEKIWEFDILNKLGYIDESQSANPAFNNARFRFKEDFYPAATQISFVQIAYIGEELKYIQKTGRATSSKILMITKNADGEYILFDGVRRNVFKGSSEDALVDWINANVSDHENLYLDFLNFENANKERAMMGTVKSKLAINYSKNLSLQRLPRDLVLFDSRLSHKLAETITEADIVATKFAGQDAYKASFQFQSTDPSRMMAATRSKVDAYSNYVDLLKSFVSKVNQKFESFSTKTSLAFQLNSIRKTVKNTMGLESDAELWLRFKNELGESMYVRILRNGKVNYYAVK